LREVGMARQKEERVDICLPCGETYTAHHAGGRCYGCGKETKTVRRVRVSLKKAEGLKDDALLDITEQIREGEEEIVVLLPVSGP